MTDRKNKSSTQQNFSAATSSPYKTATPSSKGPIPKSGSPPSYASAEQIEISGEISPPFGKTFSPPPDSKRATSYSPPFGRSSPPIYDKISGPEDVLSTGYYQPDMRFPPSERVIQRDDVPTHLDMPAHADELGRKALAESIAARMRRIRYQTNKEQIDQGTFICHLHGPWGAGKTSLMYF